MNVLLLLVAYNYKNNSTYVDNYCETKHVFAACFYCSLSRGRSLAKQIIPMQSRYTKHSSKTTSLWSNTLLYKLAILYIDVYFKLDCLNVQTGFCYEHRVNRAHTGNFH